jgi:hypothetical protein
MHFMKPIVIALLVFLIFSSRSRAQDSLRFERIGYVVGASLAFSLADYIGYNFARVDDVNDHAAWWYHAIQISIQSAISYVLYEKFGLPSAIAFNLIWWSWGDDLAYYGWADLINPPRPPGSLWENREHNGLRDNHIVWAGWTPIGLLRPQGSLIARDALVSQAMIGLSVSIAILW